LFDGGNVVGDRQVGIILACAAVHCREDQRLDHGWDTAR
jgi:hypothetical protein